jgi:hypothetical protein
VRVSSSVYLTTARDPAQTWVKAQRFVRTGIRINQETLSMAPRLAFGLFCAAVLMALPALAHHSYAAYDLIQTRTIKGTVETFKWSNPHSTFTLVLEPDGRSGPVKWNIITSSPAILKRFGWTHDSIKPGDRVSVVCNPMSDGSHGGRLHTVVLLDTGQVLRTKLSADAESKIE